MDLNKEFEKYAVKHRGISGATLHNYQTHFNPSNLTPYIIEERPLNVASMDVFSRLMMDRIIFMGEPISDIQMYINSPGGSIYAGLGIYDTMQYITPDVSTITIGIAASMGAVLMCAGAKGKRTALKHSRIMLHQPYGGAGGQATDIQIMVNEVKKLKSELYEIIAFHSGQTFDKVKEDSDRDFWMTAAEAKEYGLVDEVLVMNPRKAKDQ